MGKLAKRPMTAERFLRRGYTQGFEFVDGRMQEKVMGMKSSWVQSELNFQFRLYCRQNPGWFVFDAEGIYQCFPHKPEQVRKPDVSVLRSDRFPDGVPDGVSRLPPELVVEVVSPNEKVYELEDKVDDFRRAGVPLIWVVSTKRRRVTVYQDGKHAGELADADDLTGDPVLPGFRLKVADLFPPAPPAS